jgi:hypothetical protein
LTPIGVQGFSNPALTRLTLRGADRDGDNDGSGRSSNVGAGNGPAATLSLSSAAQALHNLSLSLSDAFQLPVSSTSHAGSQGVGVASDSAGSASGVSDLFSVADPGSQASLTTRAS